MDLTKVDFRISRHALIRSRERGVSDDMIEATLKGGKILRHSKNRLKFVKKYKNFTVICIDEIRNNIIAIVTIEVKK